jgi:hypothetical protein
MVLHPTEIERKKRCTKISGFAATVVFCLYMEEPSRSKCLYHNLFFLYTGIYLCELTFSNFFLHALPFRDSMVNPNLVPWDKFRPKNVADMMKFVGFIIHEKPRNIKFGDEKNLKGQELFSRKVRRNPLTGKISMIPTNLDCGILRYQYPHQSCLLQDPTEFRRDQQLGFLF